MLNMLTNEDQLIGFKKGHSQGIEDAITLLLKFANMQYRTIDIEIALEKLRELKEA